MQTRATPLVPWHPVTPTGGGPAAYQVQIGERGGFAGRRFLGAEGVPEERHGALPSPEEEKKKKMGEG